MLTGFLYQLYERRLLAEACQGPRPQHLGLIQDGHRRYAREAGLSNLKGYELGAAKAEEVLTWCAELGIPMVTLWWLSTDNLSREPDDVAAVLDVIEGKMPEWIHGGLAERLGIRIRPIGKLELLPTSVLRVLQHAESATQHHDRLLLNVGVGYGPSKSARPRWAAEESALLSPARKRSYGELPGDGPEGLHHLLVGPVTVLDRLLLERGAESGPELAVAEEPVHDGRGVAQSRLAVGVHRELLRVAPPVIGRVAAHARHAPVEGPALVPEELLAEGDLLGRQGVVVRDVRSLLLEAQG